MELGTDVPALLGNLNDFYQVGIGVDTYALHALGLVLLLVLVVKLVAVAVALLDECLLAVSLVHAAALYQLTLISAQAHGAAHLGNILLLLHNVNHVVWRLLVHLHAVGILVAQHVAGKLNHHHLHTQTDTECGDIVGAGVFGGDNLTLDTALTESRTNHDASQTLQLLGHIGFGNLLAVHKVHFYLHIVVDTSQIQALANTLVSILQVVFSYQSDVYLVGGMALLVKEIAPGLHGRCLAYGDTNLTHNGCVQSLVLHVHGHLVNAGQVLALHHALQIHVAERCHLHAHAVVKMALGAQYQDIGLNTHTLQFLHAVLCGLGLQLVGGF